MIKSKIIKFGNKKISYHPKNISEKMLIFPETIYFIPEYISKPSDVIVDIGAHLGIFSILAGSKATRGKIYAIEPCKETFEYLKRNIALNKFNNILAYNLALINFRGVTKLYHDNLSWGHSIVKKFSEQSENVQTDTLASFMQRNRIINCDFMKFNCEGAEFKIILSTPKDILQRIKLMLILYHSDLVENFTAKDLINYLNKAGFSTVTRNKTEKRGWIIAKNNNFYKGLINYMYVKIRFINYFFNIIGLIARLIKKNFNKIN